MTGYLFLLPALVSLLVFLIGPVIYAVGISFERFSFLDPASAKFIGLSNYIHLFHDPEFLRALLNTSIYALGVVPVQTMLALFLALIVNKIKAKSFFRVAYYLPTVTSTVAVSVMFIFLFSPYGLLNRFLALFGIHGGNYFNEPAFALPAIMVMAVWSSVGQYMIFYLAGLQEVPEEVYEAAAIDGAEGWNLTRYITMPLLKRTTFLIVVVSMIGSFQVFDQVYVISGGTGGPLNSTLSVMLDIFNKGFKTMQMGYASAMAFFLFIIILILTILQHFIIGKDD